MSLGRCFFSTYADAYAWIHLSLRMPDSLDGLATALQSLGVLDENRASKHQKSKWNELFYVRTVRVNLDNVDIGGHIINQMKKRGPKIE